MEAINKLSNAAAESAALFGSGKAHSHVTHTRPSSTKARSSGGSRAFKLSACCQPNPLTINIRMLTSNKIPSPTIVRRACGKSLERQWLNADCRPNAIEDTSRMW